MPGRLIAWGLAMATAALPVSPSPRNESCASDGARLVGQRAVAIGNNAAAPRKIRDVRPNYPTHCTVRDGSVWIARGADRPEWRCAEGLGASRADVRSSLSGVHRRHFARDPTVEVHLNLGRRRARSGVHDRDGEHSLAIGRAASLPWRRWRQWFRDEAVSPDVVAREVEPLADGLLDVEPVTLPEPSCRAPLPIGDASRMQCMKWTLRMAALVALVGLAACGDSSKPAEPGAVSPLPTPAQLAPRDGTVFDRYPRDMTVSWAPVAGAVSYWVEVEYCQPHDAWTV